MVHLLSVVEISTHYVITFGIDQCSAVLCDLDECFPEMRLGHLVSQWQWCFSDVSIVSLCVISAVTSAFSSYIDKFSLDIYP